MSTPVGPPGQDVPPGGPTLGSQGPLPTKPTIPGVVPIAPGSQAPIGSASLPDILSNILGLPKSVIDQAIGIVEPFTPVAVVASGAGDGLKQAATDTVQSWALNALFVLLVVALVYAFVTGGNNIVIDTGRAVGEAAKSGVKAAGEAAVAA